MIKINLFSFVWGALIYRVRVAIIFMICCVIGFKIKALVVYQLYFISIIINCLIAHFLHQLKHESNCSFSFLFTFFLFDILRNSHTFVLTSWKILLAIYTLGDASKVLNKFQVFFNIFFLVFNKAFNVFFIIIFSVQDWFFVIERLVCIS